jgi:DNA polymerase
MFTPQNKPILYTDTETFSTVDIKTAGTVKYCNSAELLLAGFLLKDQYHVYDYVHGPVIARWVLDHIDSGGLVAAHNALFDYIILKKVIPNLRIEQMIDTMAIVAAHGLPLSLAKSSHTLNLPVQKYAGGDRLVRRFCIPRKPTKNDKRIRITPQEDPEGWIEFRDTYLDQDIYTMVHIVERLGVLTDEQQAVWIATQKINLDGVPVDTPMARYIKTMVDQLVDDESTKFIRLTGLFPTQRDRVLGWVRSKGIRITNMQAATIEEVLRSSDTPFEVREALTARANTTHMSFKKYDTILAAEEDGVVRGTLMYHAAHTGRWGGRLLQTQNLVKGDTDSVEAVRRIKDGEFSVDLVKSAVRGMIYHPDGFSIVDYTQIEARITQWICRDQEALNILVHPDTDPYKWMATHIYQVPYEEVDDIQRFVGKQAVLGLGFQMGWERFVAQALSYGQVVPDQVAKDAVSIYRKIHKKLKIFWGNINDAAVQSVNRPGLQIKVNRFISFITDDEFLYMILPSGRRIAYFQPVVETQFFAGREVDNVSYMSMNEKNQFVRTRTFGGKLTENAAQAICTDLMSDATLQMLGQGLRVPTLVHDEAVVLGEENLDLVKMIMTTPPEWAAGLPVDVTGFSSPRFKKD